MGRFHIGIADKQKAPVEASRASNSILEGASDVVEFSKTQDVSIFNKNIANKALDEIARITETIVEVPVEVIKYVEVPVEVIKEVTLFKPVEKIKYIDKIIYQDRHIEVPVEKIVYHNREVTKVEQVYKLLPWAKWMLVIMGLANVIQMIVYINK